MRTRSSPSKGRRMPTELRDRGASAGPICGAVQLEKCGGKGRPIYAHPLRWQKPLISNAVAGERFAAGGVAGRMDVKNPIKMTGQVESTRALSRDNVKVINGKRYFFVRGEMGSNLGGRWVEEQSLRAPNVVAISADAFREMQERGSQGNMGGNEHGPGHR